MIPFKKQTGNWIDAKSIERYNRQLSWANEVIYVDEIDGYRFDKVDIGEYHPYKMQLRNQYMVDNSNIVLAVWNGSSGGTANCVRYARSKNKEIIIINPDNIKL